MRYPYAKCKRPRTPDLPRPLTASATSALDAHPFTAIAGPIRDPDICGT